MWRLRRGRSEAAHELHGQRQEESRHVTSLMMGARGKGGGKGGGDVGGGEGGARAGVGDLDRLERRLRNLEALLLEVHRVLTRERHEVDIRVGEHLDVERVGAARASSSAAGAKCDANANGRPRMAASCAPNKLEPRMYRGTWDPWPGMARTF